jgi:BMFP domain-containing protein YqiC
MTNPAWQKLVEDASKLFGSALSTAGAVRSEAEQRFKQQLQDWLTGLDLPTREEVDLLRAMLSESRQQQLQLIKRIEAIEASTASPSSEKTAKKK